MSKVSMSHIAPLILVLAAITFSGPAGAQAPEALVPDIHTGPPDMAAESARDYRERARYPEGSHPLKAGQPDPIRANITDAPRVRPSPDPGAPVLTTWKARVWGQLQIEYPAPVDLFLSLTPGKGAAPGSRVAPARSVQGEVGKWENGVFGAIGTVVYHDDGQAPDERAGDGVYSARFMLPEAHVPDLADNFDVLIAVVMADGTVERAGSVFGYSRPHGRLTGHYRDEIRQGSLVISAEIEVQRKARYHLEGTVASMADEPICHARTADELEPGRHWLDLSCYGLMFHDRQIAGPYKLATLVFREVGGWVTHAISAPVLDAHVTRAYRLEELTQEPFNEPKLLDAARRLEEPAPGVQRPPRPRSGGR